MPCLAVDGGAEANMVRSYTDGHYPGYPPFTSTCMDRGDGSFFTEVPIAKQVVKRTHRPPVYNDSQVHADFDSLGIAGNPLWSVGRWTAHHIRDACGYIPEVNGLLTYRTDHERDAISIYRRVSECFKQSVRRSKVVRSA